MIAPRHLGRTTSLPSLTDSGKPSARNESSLARNLSGISSRNSQPLPVFSRIVFDNDRDIFFSQTSANGESLSDVNTAKHITSFLNDLKNSGANINELTSFEQVAGLSGSCDLKTATLSLGTKSALSLFSLLSADQKDANLMAKAKTFHNAITKKPGSALKEMEAFTSAILDKMKLSSKAAEAKDNLKQLCCEYLKNYVYPDIIAKLDKKLSPDDMEMLRKNPADVEGHLFMGENEITNNMIKELQKEFFEFRGINGKAVVLNSLFKELEHKTQIMAGLIKLDSAAADAPASVSPAAADAPASVAGLTADNDLGQPGPANGNNTANPGPVAPNINNITYNNNYYYNWGTPSSTQNNISTTNTHLPDHADSTKSEEGKSQSAELNQIAMEVKDFSAQTSDEIDSRSVPSPTDNLKHATATNTKADKSLNSAGTLYGTTGPAPSWLGQNSTVTLTNDGQVRDLSRKQADGLGGMQQKQSTSLNNFGNKFIGFGKQNPAPAPLGGTGKIQQDAPQVSGMQSSSTVKDIPVSDNALNSGKTPQDADGIYHAVPVNTKADKSLNSAGTLYATTGPAPSWLGQNSTVTLTNDGQVRDLSRKQADGLGGMQQKQSTSLNNFGNKFIGFGKQNPAPAPLGGTGKIQQDAPQVSGTKDFFVSSNSPNFITTLDIQVNSNGTLQQTTEGIYHATPAKVVAERQLNAQGTSLGMKAGAASASTQSEMANNDSTVTLTNDGLVRDLSRKLAYKLGSTLPKNISSVNAQGNQFVGVGKNPPIPERTQSWLNNKGDNVVLTQEGAQTRALTQKDQYRVDKITHSQPANMQPTHSPEAE